MGRISGDHKGNVLPGHSRDGVCGLCFTALAEVQAVGSDGCDALKRLNKAAVMALIHRTPVSYRYIPLISQASQSNELCTNAKRKVCTALTIGCARRGMTYGS